MSNRRRRRPLLGPWAGSPSLPLQCRRRRRPRPPRCPGPRPGRSARWARRRPRGAAAILLAPGFLAEGGGVVDLARGVAEARRRCRPPRSLSRPSWLRACARCSRRPARVPLPLRSTVTSTSERVGGWASRCWWGGLLEAAARGHSATSAVIVGGVEAVSTEAPSSHGPGALHRDARDAAPSGAVRRKLQHERKCRHVGQVGLDVVGEDATQGGQAW